MSEDEMRSRPHQGLISLSAKDWIYGHAVRLEPSDLPQSLNDVIFIKRSEVDIVRRVGGGSFGDVYKGNLYNEKVAIKMFKVQNSVARVGQLVGSDDGLDMQDQNGKAQRRIVDLVNQLVREVRVLKSISFSKIVQFYGVCLEPAAIVTEFCPNKSLFEYIGLARSDTKYAEALTWKRRLQIVYDAACGMHYLHSRDNAIVHRDLKSPNLLLDENMNCKICDFNTARFVGTKAVTNSISANNPLWLAPEILQGHPFTRSSDVYPFGIILWELMTLMVPFEQNGEPKNPHAVMFGVVFKNDRPDIPRNEDLPGGPCPVYKSYCHLIEQCWHREPGKRPTFAAIELTLKKLLEGECETDSSLQTENKSVPEHPERITRSARFRAPFFKSSVLKRSKVMSRDIEEQIKQNNPDIKAAWEDNREEDVMRDLDQLPTPFARGLCSRPSDESFADELPDTPGGHADAVASPNSIQSSDLQTYLSGASVGCRGIQGISSVNPTPQGRWNKIRDVVRLISARKRAHEMLSLLGLKPVADPNVPSSSSAKETPQENIENSESMEKSQAIPVNSVGDVKPRESMWKFLQQQFCPNVSSPTHHNYWDQLARHLSATTQLHTMTSFRPRSSGIESPMTTSTRAASNWALVKEMLQLNGLEGYPRTPESWRPLLNVLFPSCNCDFAFSQSVRGRADRNGTSKSSATEDQMKKWFIEYDRILRKHKSFLQSVSSEMGKSSSAEGPFRPNSAMQHESANTKGEFVSQDMWDFVRDCLLETSLPSAWDPVIKFMRGCTSISSQDLHTLRDLMSRADEDQTHEVSGILKPFIFHNK